MSACSLLSMIGGVTMSLLRTASCGQWRLWSVCTDMPADLSLCCLHRLENRFSHEVAHDTAVFLLMWPIYWWYKQIININCHSLIISQEGPEQYVHKTSKHPDQTASMKKSEHSLCIQPVPTFWFSYPSQNISVIVIMTPKTQALERNQLSCFMRILKFYNILPKTGSNPQIWKTYQMA